MIDFLIYDGKVAIALSDLLALVLETQATGNYEFASEFEN